MRGDVGPVVRIDGFAQDVTELARAESQQRTAAALGRLALSGVPIDVLMREAVDAVAEELELDFAGVAEARPRAAGSWSAAQRPQRAGRGEVELDDDSLTAQVLRTGGPLIVPDWEQETRIATRRSPVSSASAAARRS